MQKKLKQHEIDEVVKGELKKQEKPDLIQVHISENRKHKICRKCNLWKDPHLTIWMKLWIKIKGWFR